MLSDDFERLRGFEGQIVRVTSTEGEVMVAKVLSVSEEHLDVVVDVLSTNQPERYERLGKKYTEGAWAIPFEFIASVSPEAHGTGATGMPGR
ncbi:MAG: hypothetical protein ACRD18_04840 [Terriglobia bacterium]